ncbi:hypothetical protein WMY93_005895 [Mugilogobius chulae]|uniref:Gypsy retrotransposon integrase-like protein 1 n=1 Tax=Mugilogobius chulae TaxID=88201 RepID=A0AAW0PJ48_9GOBI
MNTRQGKIQMEEGPCSTTLDQQGAKASGPKDKIEELAGMMKYLIDSQNTRDKKAETERTQQEQRWKSVQDQVNQLQQQLSRVQAERSAHPERVSQPVQVTLEGPTEDDDYEDYGPRYPYRPHREPKLLPLAPDDDIEHFLTTFERMAQVCRWPDEEWAVRLVPLLTGKARSAYVVMDMKDAEDYDKVKDAILAKYEITSETYRRRFRSLHIEPNETPRELYVRLKELFTRWIQPEKTTIQKMSEKLILEQFLRMVTPELEVWIKEHDPDTAEEAARLAEVFMSARRGTRSSYFGREPRQPMPSKSFGGDGSGPVQSRNSSRSAPPIQQSRPVKKHSRTPPQEVRCYNCNELGHTQHFCPALKSRHSLLCSVPRPATVQTGQRTGRTTAVLVNGHRAEALLDSGCFQTVVLSSLVPLERQSSDQTPLVCIHGDEHRYPTAEVYLTVGGQTYLVNVALAKNLPFAVILGNDIPTLPDLIVQADVAHPERVVEPVVEPLVQCTPESAKPCNVFTRAQIARGVFEELPFCDEELETQPCKTKKPKAQKRREKFVGSQKGKEELPKPLSPLEVCIPSDIGALQKEDATLKPWFDKVKEQEGIKTGKGSCLDEASYVVKNGLLYQVKDKNEALALPEKLRVQVMELGHAVPWAGHMAFQKTLRRIGSRFAWPGMFSQVSKFCSSCKVCQLTSNKGVARAHLQPLPIIGTPFERIGMDIVGPLERSSAGNRYILVLSDYATRYPEAFPLRSIKAKQIANCLLQLFSRVGVVKEILTDCGTNFLSKLLQQVYQLLGVKGIRTTPYHPQTDGLVERYNQTLKSMLRKFVSTTSKDWDQWLPYLLFAFREVPQASTGFSPFELLYGRQVRGPLDLLKDHWERTEPEGDNVVAYVLKMRERLQAMAAMAQENLKAAQTSQKTWYDQKAKNRTFTPGQKVLLLLPTSENKLLAKWHGPYEITKQVSNVTYELFMPERLKKHQVFHINLLKEFIVRQEPSQQFLVRAVKDEEVSEKFFPIPAAEPAAIDLSHLSPSQQDELKPLLNADLFQETPGFTSLVQHQIRLKQDAPKRQRSYRIPERLVPVLKKEIELMLELGIIEISDSEWCSPVVLVPKKDGSLRFCIDFRYLNAISNFDPYPMPRIDELLERVGSAAYITTLDLSRGYWQLALAPEARELTAFKTPFGLFQFRVMPFGLQGAPATFQRLMDHVLRDVSQFSAAYLDDVVIYSRSWKEHLHHLQEVLKRIQAAGLTINPKKCAMAHREVEYLGYTIGFGKIKPQVQKMEAICSFPVPTTKKKVRGFIGLVGWYRKFIPQFADRSAILNDLTKNSAPNKSPDFDLPFILQTDASGVGLGAVLLQEKDGDRRPVVFLSRRLLDQETRYSAVEKECLAMKWAIDSLRYYLLGRHFILETDHRALQWLHRMREANTRIAGWYLALQPYNFTVHYKPGKTNIVADCLSRIDEE